ncbi:hypothetical protein QFZ51_005453 [Chitinophaga sp. W3I9]
MSVFLLLMFYVVNGSTHRTKEGRYESDSGHQYLIVGLLKLVNYYNIQPIFILLLRIA